MIIKSPKGDFSTPERRFDLVDRITCMIEPRSTLNTQFKCYPADDSNMSWIPDSGNNYRVHFFDEDGKYNQFEITNRYSPDKAEALGRWIVARLNYEITE